MKEGKRVFEFDPIAHDSTVLNIENHLMLIPVKKISIGAFLFLLISVPLIVRGKSLQFHANTKSTVTEKEADERFLDLMSEHYEYGIKLGSVGVKKSMLSQVKREATLVLREQIAELSEIQALDKKYPSKIKNVQISKPKDHTPDLEKLKGKEFEENFIMRMAFHFEDGEGILKKAIPVLKGKNHVNLAKKLLRSQSESAKRFSKLEAELHKR